MLALVVALALSQADAGFSPVVLSVHHGEVHLDLPDGGFEAQPTLVPSGVFMDEATASWVAQQKARARAEQQVKEEPLAVKQALWVFGAGFGIATIATFVLAWFFFR